MGFNSGFKGLNSELLVHVIAITSTRVTVTPHASLKVRKIFVKSVQIVTEYTTGSLVSECTVLDIQTKNGGGVCAHTLLCKDAWNDFPIFLSSFVLKLVRNQK